MKSVLLFFITALTAFAAHATEIKTRVGIISQNSANSALSQALGTSVVLLGSRGSYNPIVQVSNQFSNYETKVIYILVDNQHYASCGLTLIKDRAEAMINNCLSDSAAIDFKGFISFSSLGINLPRY